MSCAKEILNAILENIMFCRSRTSSTGFKITGDDSLNTNLPASIRCLCLMVLLVLSASLSSVATAATSIMAIGDSITRGVRNFTFSAGDYPVSAYRLDSGGPPNNIRSYREHLHDSLIESSCSASVEWVGTQSISGRTPLQHEGHSGMRADQILAELPNWLSVSTPDVILLNVGTNDMLQGQPAGNVSLQTGTIKEIDDILNVIDAYENSVNQSIPVFIGNAVPVFGWWANHNLRSGDAADIASEAAILTSLIGSLAATRANAGDNLHLVDVNSSFFVNENNIANCQTGTPGDSANMMRSECINVPFTGQPPDLEPDGVHPNLVGERFLADQFFSELRTHTSLCEIGGSNDNVGPTGTISAPEEAVSFAPNNSFLIEGSYADDSSGVSLVEVQVERTTVNPREYWTGNSWGTSATFVDAVIDGNGSWNLPDVDLSDYGTYRISLRIHDTAGNISNASQGPVAEFFVGASTFIDTPVTAGLLLPTTVTLNGYATSHGVGFNRVRIAINLAGTSQWWNFDSELFGSFDSVNAALINESSVFADWEVLVTGLPPNGDYIVYALAIDGDNKSAYINGPPDLWPTNQQFFTGAGGSTCNGLPVTVDLNLGQTPGPGSDVILGTPGNDDIRGRAGDDTICGMGGNDFIHGNSGDDWIDGGDGIDNIRGGQGNDTLFAGRGATAGNSSRVFGGTGDDFITGGRDDDDLRGGRGNDVISGMGGADLITGNEDDDDLFGGSGGDTLKGGNGENDELFGEGGSDSLNGGSGANDSCIAGGQLGEVQTNCEGF